MLRELLKREYTGKCPHCSLSKRWLCTSCGWQSEITLGWPTPSLRVGTWPPPWKPQLVYYKTIVTPDSCIQYCLRVSRGKAIVAAVNIPGPLIPSSQTNTHTLISLLESGSLPEVSTSALLWKVSASACLQNKQIRKFWVLAVINSYRILLLFVSLNPFWSCLESGRVIISPSNEAAWGKVWVGNDFKTCPYYQNSLI